MIKSFFLTCLLMLVIGICGAETPAQIKIRYADLIDTTIIIHAGIKLKLAVQDPAMSGQVQPHVDRFSYLLQYALEMVRGPEPIPYHDVADYYPAGSEQPAWAALIRNGKAYVMTDDQGRVRLYLPGDDPKAAYRDMYPVLRHCLVALQANNNAALKVEVYVYRHDYTTSEMTLKQEPYVFTSADFKPPAGKIVPDLAALTDFFRQGYELTACHLDRDKGLILYGRPAAKQTVNGRPMTIADLAVAYRATVRAGENRAYISLDPSDDPTLAAVNFGGFLENTYIGQVVLDADKRFKTITSGHDYMNFADLYDRIRQDVPTFLSVEERDFLAVKTPQKPKGWIKTRFWFYPDSIKIRTDDKFEYAAIVQPRFVADAERDQADFKSPKEFEKKKQALLPVSIRAAIDDLNAHYDRYAAVFQDIRELDPIARLMGICSWLGRAQTSWLDLDALLAVKIPAYTTQIVNPQFITYSYLTYQQDQTLDEAYVKNNMKSFYATPDLDRRISEYFAADSELAVFLCFKNNKAPGNFKKYNKEADRILKDRAELPVRTLLSNINDVKAFANYAGYVQKKIMPPAYNNYLRILDSLDAAIKEYEKATGNATGNEATYNYYVKEHNKAVEEYNAVNQKINKMGVMQPVSSAISGGVDLDPQHITVETDLTYDDVSTLFKDLKASAEGVSGGSDSLTLSARKDMPDLSWTTKTDVKEGKISFRMITARGDRNAWQSMDQETGAWRTQQQFTANRAREETFDPKAGTLTVASWTKGGTADQIIGTRVDDHTIVFARAPAEKTGDHSTPPQWWIK